MKDDLTPAFRRLAALRRQESEIYAKRHRELRRLRQIGQRDLKRALRPLRLVKEQTILEKELSSGKRWDLGIYRGARVSTPPEKPDAPWYVVIYFRSVLKSGKPGRHFSYHTFSGATPAEAVACLRVVGVAVLPTGAK